MSIFNKKSEVKMTEGNIANLLISFAIPLVLGNLFQMLYNMVDTWVVGNFVSDNAFSAVGTVAPIMNMFIFAFMGFSSGAGIVVSQYFGAGNLEKVKRTVSTMAIMTFICCVAFTVIAYTFTPQMIGFMKSPDGVFEEQVTYLHIIFAFISFQVIYNMASAILRAIGDSTRPFIFLVVAAVSNVILDLLFVIKFNMGVAGVAWATIISQGLSAALCVWVLFTTETCVKLNLKDMKFEKQLAGQIIRVGIPTAIQQSITAFSNIFVQGYINVFGASVMGGWTIYTKVDQIVMLPQQSMALSTSTFVGQNLGAGDPKRAKKGMWTALLITEIASVVLILLVTGFSGPISRFFTGSEEIVKYGQFFLYRITPFMLCGGVSQITISALRGSGNSLFPMIVNLGCYVGIRQLYLYTVSRIWPGQLGPVSFAYPVGWTLCAIIMLVYYRFKGFGTKSAIA